MRRLIPYGRAADSIRVFSDPVLRRPARDVSAFDDDLRALIDRLFRVQAQHKAVGVAASQIGDDRNVFTLDHGQIRRGGKPQVYINARIVDHEDEAVDEEGCLSFPGIYVNVARPKRVTLSALDAEGRPFEREGKGLLARAFSHETDHLRGRLLIDRLAPDVRHSVVARMRRLAAKLSR